MKSAKQNHDQIDLIIGFIHAARAHGESEEWIGDRMYSVFAVLEALDADET